MATKIAARKKGAIRSPREAGEIAAWAAQCNIASQEALLAAINVTSEVAIEEVAERLGVTADEARSALSGGVDLTLRELRLLGIASEVVIRYQVTPARRDYARFLKLVMSRSQDFVEGPDVPDPELQEIFLARFESTGP